MDKYKSSCVLTKLLVSISRDEQPEGSPRYVQDNIHVHGEQVAELITEKAASIYVCGDATNMAKDVNAAFVNILQVHKGNYMFQVWYRIYLISFVTFHSITLGMLTIVCYIGRIE